MSMMQRFHHRHVLRFTNRRRCAMEHFEDRLALSAAAGDAVVHVFRSGGWITIEADEFAYFDSFDGSVLSDGTAEPTASPASTYETPHAAPADNWGVEVPGESVSLAGTPRVPRTQTPLTQSPGTPSLSDLVDDSVDSLSGDFDLTPPTNSLDEPIREIPRRGIGRGTAPDLEGGERIVLKAVRRSEEPIGPLASTSFNTNQGTAEADNETSNELANQSSGSTTSAVADLAGAGDEALERPQARALFFEVAANRSSGRSTTHASQQAATPTQATGSNDWLVRQQTSPGGISPAANLPSGQHTTATTVSFAAGQSQPGFKAAATPLSAAKSVQAANGHEAQQKQYAMQRVDAAFDTWGTNRAAVSAPFFLASDQNQQVGLAIAVAALVAVEHTLGLRCVATDKNTYQRPQNQPPERKPR